MAVASIYARSPTLLDRISNALSKEAAVKVIGDCERIVRTGLDRGEIRQSTVKRNNSELPALIVREGGEEGKERTVIGYMATTTDVESFIEQVERDVYSARKAGAIAMSIVNSTLLGGGEGQ